MQLIPVLATLMLIGLVLWISERMARSGRWPVVISRKLVHLVAVSAVAISPLLIPQPLILVPTILAFTLLLLWAVWNNKFTIDKGRRKSWGIVLFPIAFLVLYAGFESHHPWIVTYSMLVLAFSDAAAALVGETLARNYYHLTTDRKSLVGSAAFVGCTVLVLTVLPPLLQGFDQRFALPDYNLAHWQWWASLALLALVAATAEALGSGGTDNLLVPWASALLLWLLLQQEALLLVALAIGLSAMVCGLAWKRGWLDAGGAVAAALLGMMVWAAGTWTTALPMVLFFAAGSLAGRLPRSASIVADFKHRRPRDWVQVLSNGGIAGGLLCIYLFQPAPGFLFLYLVSIGISMADTMSSELGQWANGRVVDCLTWKPLPAGLSGGISWQGTAAGLLGACLVALAGWAANLVNPAAAVAVVFFGFAGMLADSWLGSAWQARYQLRSSGQQVEHLGQGEEGSLVKGLRWMTNDRVNLLANLLVTLLAALYWWVMVR